MKKIENNFDENEKIFKSKKIFDFINDEKLIENLYDFLAYVSIIAFFELNKLENKKIIELKTHTVIIYLGSIIESVLYYFINEIFINNEKKRKKYLKIKEFKSIQKIKISEESNKEYHFCEVFEKEISLNDTINFSSLINGAKDNKILSEEIVEKINNIRKLRNSIHINVYKTGELIKFDELKQIFIDTKDILDYIEEKLENK
ncbi:MAG: hypothetical protein Q9M94_00740 [Candidatus Gracilibacteria bacterium]|nr:hypothetical protein [Candidatus Gracilibacteria bacterium]